jgi:hypothetical protein
MNRRGAALLIVVAGILLLSALASGIFALARLRHRSGEAILWSTAARIAAEGEVERARASWDPMLAETLTVGSAAPLASAARGRGVSSQDSLVRLGAVLYLLRAVGERRAADGALLAREGVARLVHLKAPQVPAGQAVLAAGPLTVGESSVVDGADRAPPAWSAVCPAPGADGAGVRAASTAPVTIACTGACLNGAPPLALDSALTLANLLQFGPMSLAELAAGADHEVGGTVASVGPVETLGQCASEDPLNWGDPQDVSRPCGRHLPVVRALPGTRVEGGVGQGVLIGTGALELAGDLAFHGVVVAGGPLTLRDRARVIGTLITADSLRLQGTATVERSVCAIARAQAGAARPAGSVAGGWFLWP